MNASLLLGLGPLALAFGVVPKQVVDVSVQASARIFGLLHQCGVFAYRVEPQVDLFLFTHGREGSPTVGHVQMLNFRPMVPIWDYCRMFVGSKRNNAMNAPTFPPTFTKFVYSGNKGFEYQARTATFEEAASWADSFPKTCKVYASHLGGDASAKGVVIFRVMLPASNPGMGVENEAGQARLRSFLRNAKKLGLRVDHP